MGGAATKEGSKDDEIKRLERELHAARKGTVVSGDASAGVPGPSSKQRRGEVSAEVSWAVVSAPLSSFYGLHDVETQGMVHFASCSSLLTKGNTIRLTPNPCSGSNTPIRGGCNCKQL